jgi:hypothetical protein
MVSLARYKEQRSDHYPRDFFVARKWYEKALQLKPDMGSPFNQLAVVSTYESDELSAVYYYYRGMLVKTPFPTAKENLALLFQKNAKLFESKRPLTGSFETMSRKDFTRLFIYTTGLLFHRDLEKLNQVAESMSVAFQAGLKTGMFSSADDVLRMVIIIISALFQMKSDEIELQKVNGLLLIRMMKSLVLAASEKHVSAAKTVMYAKALRAFLLWLAFSSSGLKPAMESSDWIEMTQMLIRLLNEYSAPLSFDKPVKILSFISDDEALRGFLPLELALPDSYFAQRSLIKKDKEQSARTRSILFAAEKCADLQVS